MDVTLLRMCNCSRRTRRSTSPSPSSARLTHRHSPGTSHHCRPDARRYRCAGTWPSTTTMTTNR